MHTLSIVVPKFLREDGDLFYKVSKVEQMGEKLHKDFNDLENQYRNIIDKPKKSYLKFKRYEMNQFVKKICFPKYSK